MCVVLFFYSSSFILRPSSYHLSTHEETGTIVAIGCVVVFSARAAARKINAKFNPSVRRLLVQNARFGGIMVNNSVLSHIPGRSLPPGNYPRVGQLESHVIISVIILLIPVIPAAYRAFSSLFLPVTEDSTTELNSPFRQPWRQSKTFPPTWQCRSCASWTAPP